MFWLGGCAPEPTPAPPIEARFSGVSTPYQAAFRKDLARLASDLAPCTSEPVTVDVRYVEREGLVRLAGRWERCLPVLAGDEVDLGPIVPVATALARYRNALAASADPRLATFRLAVGLDRCSAVLSGQFPPDGTTFAPCSACPPGAEGVDRIRDGELQACVAALRGPEAPPAPGPR